MTKANDAVTKMMASKVSADSLTYKEQPNCHETLVLDLACEMHASRSLDVAISWEAQCEAAAYFNAHGFERSLDRMLELQAANATRPEAEETSV